MKRKLLLPLVTLAALVMAPAALAATESVNVILYFNIGAVDELTVTLLGETAVTSSGGGTSTPANIEFNSSTGTTYWQNATVTGGGSTQDETNAILNLDNTGTTNLNTMMSTNSSLNACLDLAYDTSYRADPSVAKSINSTSNATLDPSYTPAEAAIDVWLWGNFSGCIDADDDSTLLTIYAVTV